MTQRLPNRIPDWKLQPITPSAVNTGCTQEVTHWIYEAGSEYQNEWAELLSSKLKDTGYTDIFGSWQELENGKALIFNALELDPIKLFTSRDYHPETETLTGLNGFNDPATNGATLVFNRNEIRFADLLA
jgi:hypothetical protein